MYTLSDTRLEWPREGPLFELDLNKCYWGAGGGKEKCGHYSIDPWVIIYVRSGALG